VGNSFIYAPLANSWKARAEQIQKLRDALNHGTNMVNRANAILGRWNNMKTNALPAETSQGQAQLQKAFAKWEAASRVVRVGYKPQWKDSDENYTTLDCRVEYNGSFDQILSFLYNLGKDPMGIKVDELEIATRDEFGQQLALTLQVSALRLSPPDTTQN
jgi:Tfp pilus assembly protein PilO